MEKAQARRVDGAWADLPAETWAYAAGLVQGGDLERRIALLLLDNAVEMALRSYLERPVRDRGGPPIKWERDPNFWHLLNGFEECFASWPSGTSREQVEWLHSIRNRLHHDGNGVAPRSKDLDSYVQVARVLNEHLFGPRAIETAHLERSLAASLLDESPEDPRPPLVRELDDLIVTIRTLLVELPAGAPSSLAIPAGAHELAQRAEQLVIEIGMEWSSEMQESTTDFLDWDFYIDDFPSQAEDAIEVLERLRYLVRLALS